MKNMKIIIEKRWDDYMAYAEGRREIWGCGENQDAAVGNVIHAHKDFFGIDVEEVKG